MFSYVKEGIAFCLVGNFSKLKIFLRWNFSNVEKLPADCLRSKKIITINLKPLGPTDYFVIPL